MAFIARTMHWEDAKVVCDWIYEPPYDFYNMGASDESINELLNGSYKALKSMDGDVVGFYCVGESAQVPAGLDAGAYPARGDVVDFGIGMRPDLTGQGLGTEFLAYILHEMIHDHPSADLRLTVATFNRRAIRLYERFGFQPGVQFGQNGATFQTMTRPAGNLLWIRRATAEDERYLHDWLADFRDCVGAIGHEPFTHKDFVTWMDADEQRLWVLESESDPVGYGEVWIDDEERDTELAHLVVAPEHRGKGLGVDLVKLLFTEATHAGYPFVYMRVSPENERALACYRRAGFEVMATLPDRWPREYVWMRRANGSRPYQGG